MTPMIQGLIELGCSVVGVVIMLRSSRSFGAYTERVERSNEITRVVLEAAVERIDRRRDEAERVLQSVRRLKMDLLGSDDLSEPLTAPPPAVSTDTQRSA